jgi:protein-S-isoprenylcysteine O-methyltransferase Ste14
VETRGRALIVVPLIIGGLCGVFGVLGYLLGSALGIPNRLHMAVALRGAGVGVLALGFFFMGWLYRYRKPIDVVVSTYVTMRKSVKGAPPREAAARKEPLILEGPQRHVRHPLYFAVVALWLGWWLVLDYTLLLLMAIFFFLWFNFVVIRFEEQELRALFGEEYEAYARAVPKFFPSWKARWR